MPACEKCWADASLAAQLRGGSTADRYRELLQEREGHPCTPQEQAGQWWNEEAQKDSRTKEPLSCGGYYGGMCWLEREHDGPCKERRDD